MSEQNQQVQGGHVIKIMINDKVIGFGRSSTYGQDYGTEGVYALGDIGPLEHVEMRWSSTITLDSYVLNASAVQEASVQLFELMAQGPEEVKTQTKFNLTVLGRNDELVTLLECTASNFSMNFQANQFSGQNATFMAKNVRRGRDSVFQDVNASTSSELVA